MLMEMKLPADALREYRASMAKEAEPLSIVIRRRALASRRDRRSRGSGPPTKSRSQNSPAPVIGTGQRNVMPSTAALSIHQARSAAKPLILPLHFVELVTRLLQPMRFRAGKNTSSTGHAVLFEPEIELLRLTDRHTLVGPARVRSASASSPA